MLNLYQRFYVSQTRGRSLYSLPLRFSSLHYCASDLYVYSSESITAYRLSKMILIMIFERALKLDRKWSRTLSPSTWLEVYSLICTVNCLSYLHPSVEPSYLAQVSKFAFTVALYCSNLLKYRRLSWCSISEFTTVL